MEPAWLSRWWTVALGTIFTWLLEGTGAALAKSATSENATMESNESMHSNETHEEHNERYQVAKFDFQYVATNFIVAIWVLFASLAKIVFHTQKRLSRLFPESCLLIIIGILLGIILHYSGIHDYELNIHTFFLILLPPIIFDAGYFMPSRSFFDQLGTILLYAVVGTLLNTLLIGFSMWGVYMGGGFQLSEPLLLLHALVFASLLAAVDPVAVLAVFESVKINEILHIVVFGESLLNDGISVVLYHLFEGLSEIGSEYIQVIDVIAGVGSFFVITLGATGIGVVCGLIGGIISRFTHHVRLMEPLIIFTVGYLSFMLGEMFHLSGILSCTFCGITMKKYAEANISAKSKTTIKYLLKMLSSVCETIIFMYLGIAAVSDSHHWDTAFVILTLLFCLIYRSLCVILQTFFANKIRVLKFNAVDQFIMAYGGLRGAIAFALVVLLDPKKFPHRSLFITSTVVVIYFTNLVMGSTILPLVNFLKVKKADKRKPTLNEKIMYRCMDHLMAGIEDITQERGHHLLRERFSHINNKYIKPCITGKRNSPHRGWALMQVYERVVQKDNAAYLRSNASTASFSRMQSHEPMRDPSVQEHMDRLRWWDSKSFIPDGCDSPAPRQLDASSYVARTGRRHTLADAFSLRTYNNYHSSRTDPTCPMTRTFSRDTADDMDLSKPRTNGDVKRPHRSAAYDLHTKTVSFSDAINSDKHTSKTSEDSGDTSSTDTGLIMFDIPSSPGTLTVHKPLDNDVTIRANGQTEHVTTKPTPSDLADDVFTASPDGPISATPGRAVNNNETGSTRPHHVTGGGEHSGQIVRNISGLLDKLVDDHSDSTRTESKSTRKDVGHWNAAFDEESSRSAVAGRYTHQAAGITKRPHNNENV